MRSVPFWTTTDATAPRPRPSLASITVPTAGRSGRGLQVGQIGHQADHLLQQIEVGRFLAETSTKLITGRPNFSAIFSNT